MIRTVKDNRTSAVHEGEFVKGLDGKIQRRAREKLKAVAASKADAEALGCAEGAPLLCISRVAFDLEGNPVELRVSRCLTENVHYLSELR